MNWLTNFVKPKLSSLVKRRSVPEKLWNNCVSCGNMIHHKDLKENLYVCVNCNYHFRMSAEDRIKLFFEDGNYSEISPDKISDDPLKFTDKKKYKDRLDHELDIIIKMKYSSYFLIVSDYKKWAKKNNYQYFFEEPKQRKIKPKSYASNFDTNRKEPWTH